MSGKKNCPLLLLLIITIIFDLVVAATLSLGGNSNSSDSDILYEIIPFIKVYKNGSIERLMGTQSIPPSLDPTTNVISKDVIIPSHSHSHSHSRPSLNISARLYLPSKPAAAAKLPLLVYFHGGAFFVSSPFDPTYHSYINSVVAKAGVVAVSVNYRLAPEHPLPAAYHDSWLALKWIFSHSDKGKGKGRGREAWLLRYVDFERVYLAGDSAGGNIAHNVAMRAGSGRDRGEVVIHGMFLNCPHFWGKIRIGNEASYPQLVAMEDSIWMHAYPNSSGFDDPVLNPDFNRNLGRLGCKKVLVYVAEKDVLRDRGLEYKKALEKRKWGGVVNTVEVKGAVHVFNLQFPNSTDAKEMMNNMALFLNDNIIIT